MSKQLKDYLHLYLGCEFVLRIKDTDKLSASMMFGTEAYRASYSDNQDKIFPLLLLRPLSDLTEDEGFELSDTMGFFTPDNFITAIKSGSKYVMDFRLSFELTQYLLKQGFDLFNLIPEGLAIDKTKNQ